MFLLKRLQRLALLLLTTACSSICTATLRHNHGEEHEIPHVLHQSWKNRTVPDEFKAMAETWRAKHPTWHYRLWTDAANWELVKGHYPWFYPTYAGLPLEIMRADAARCLYMHRYGGLYADLDFMALKPFDELLKGKLVVLGSLSNDTEFLHNVPNAWMASVPGHDFWLFCLQEITKAAHGCDVGVEYSEWEYVESIAGPAMIKRALDAYTSMNATDVTILSPSIIYPIDWRLTSPGWNFGSSDWDDCSPDAEAFNATACIGRFNGTAYSLTFWAHTWA